MPGPGRGQFTATRTDDPPVVGIQEIAAMFETSEGTVGSWRNRAHHEKHATGFPDPDWFISGRPIWRRETIRAWGRKTKRMNPDGTVVKAAKAATS